MALPSPCPKTSLKSLAARDQAQPVEDAGHSLRTDSGTNLVVKVNNLCPIQENELCNMQTLQNTNKEGMSGFSVGMEGLCY